MKRALSDVVLVQCETQLRVPWIAAPTLPSKLQSQFTVCWKEVPNYQKYHTDVQQVVVVWRFLSLPRGLGTEVEFLS